MLITYDSIVVKLGGKEIATANLQRLSITRKINEHVRLQLTGVVPDDQTDHYVESSDAETVIEVNSVKDGETLALFKGIITQIGIHMVRDIYYFEIEALSYTHLLDVAVKSRPFQDQTIGYEDLIYQIIGQNGICNYQGDASDTLGTLLIQYRETDWELLKRMASTFHTGLVAYAGSGNRPAGDKAQFGFGIPEGRERRLPDKLHYTVCKEIAAYRRLSADPGADLREYECVTYDMLTEEFFDIGDTVSFNQRTLYVAESSAEMEGSILTFKCRLTFKYGLQQPRLANTQLIGAVLEGRVTEVAGDQVRVHLVLGEDPDPEAAYWFSYLTAYTAEGHTGSYCMPEISDYVKVQFPSTEAGEAVASAAIRHGGSDDKTGDPQVKYFRTAFGKEIMFNETEILISAQDDQVLVRISEEKGVEIYSEQPVSIQGKEVTIQGKDGITLESENAVTISAGTLVDIKCNASEIQLDGATQIAGSQVKVN